MLQEAYETVIVNEGLDTVGHVALDLVGLIPGVGEFADATNAVWHASKGEYLMAALSLISVIPVVGDAVGKGGKVAAFFAKGGKAGQAIGRGAQIAGPHIVKAKRVIRANKPLIDKVMGKARENEKLAPYVDHIQGALDHFSAGGTEQAVA